MLAAPMSYDLYFRARSAGGVPKIGALADYFAAQRHVTINELERGGVQAWYENKATGVYFSFDLSEGETGDDEAPPDPLRLPVAYNINYYRPHTFGLEAEPVVTAFVRHFELLVSDPQASGMGDGEYTPEGFLSGWNAGNAFGYRAMRAHFAEDGSSPPEVDCLPAATNEAVWRWNYGVADYTELLCEVELVCGFVPSIFLMKLSGRPTVTTAVVWGDAIPIALPDVELIMVPGEKLRGIWFRDLAHELAGAYDSRGPDHEIDIGGRSHRLGLSHTLVDYGSGTAPAALVRRIAALAQPLPPNPVRLAPDSVLTAELLT